MLDPGHFAKRDAALGRRRTASGTPLRPSDEPSTEDGALPLNEGGVSLQELIEFGVEAHAAERVAIPRTTENKR